MKEAMIDIETTSLDPHHGAILQIAVVKFDLQSLTIHSDYFYRSLAIPPGRFWDEQTLHWWQKDKMDVLSDIYSRREPAQTVMQELADFVAPMHSVRFWSKPSHFDFPFIDGYFKMFNIPSMFSYREATDMNSFIRGLYPLDEKPRDFYKELSVDGKAHNALHDALLQIKILFAHIEHRGTK